MEDTKQDHALTNGNGLNGHNGNINNGNNNNSCDDSDTESEAEEAEPVSATLVLRVVSEPPSPAASRKSSYRCGLELSTKLRNVFTVKTSQMSARLTVTVYLPQVPRPAALLPRGHGQPRPRAVPPGPGAEVNILRLDTRWETLGCCSTSI